MRETTVICTYTCDVCGIVAKTPRGAPDGWRDVRIAFFGGEEATHHVCANEEPSCFRRLLIKLANEDKEK